MKIRLINFILFFLPALIISYHSRCQPGHTSVELSPAFHRERREMLREKMPPQSVAIFFSNPERNRSNDVDYPYHQDPDFYYLTGYTEPNAVLLIFKDEQQNKSGEKYREIIFVQPKNAFEEMWYGKRLGIEGVKEQLGFSMVYANADFRYYDPGYSNFRKILYKTLPESIRKSNSPGDLYDLINIFLKKTGMTDSIHTDNHGVNFRRKLDNTTLDRILDQMREIKTPEEISILKKAIDITCIGHMEAMKAAHPGISERAIQGVHEFIHRYYGSEAEGYPPIVGSGNNACTLHYEENSRTNIDSGDLVLMDVGAEYHGYSADITRTIPVSGRFTPEQKKIYDLVLKAQQASIDNCRQGISFKDFEKAGQDIIADGLVELGIISVPEDYTNYLPHGLSHHLGLDVHDRGEYDVLKENMVVTIEPGIYIPMGSDCDKKWWKTGVRIEDDLLVGKKGCEVLSGSLPKTTEDIESVMSQPGILTHYELPEIR